MIESTWRIELGPSILCGSASDSDLWQPALDRFVGQEVQDLAIFGRLPEVLLSVSNDLHVASFCTDDGNPGWALFDRRTEALVTLGCHAGRLMLDPPL